jgi:hypothetical protein
VSGQASVRISDAEAAVLIAINAHLDEPVTLRDIRKEEFADLPLRTFLQRVASLKDHGLIATAAMDELVIPTGQVAWETESTPGEPMGERIAVLIQHVVISASMLALVGIGVRLGGAWVALSVCACALLLWITRRMLVFSDFYGRYTGRAPVFRSGAIISTGLFVSLTAVFAAVTAILLTIGAVTEAEPLDQPTVLYTFGYYFWNFLDAIPALDVPETLHWARPAEFTDRLSGVLLLAYKLLAILPLVGILQAILSRARQT